MDQLTIFDFIEEVEKQVPLFHYSQRIRVREPNESDDPETVATLEQYKKAVGVVTDVYFSSVYSEYCYGVFLEKEKRIIFLQESDFVGGVEK